MSNVSLKPYCGHCVGDDGEFSSLPDIIEELEGFADQFSTHAMSDHGLFLKGKAEAYRDVIDYLSRVKPPKGDNDE